MNDIQRYLVEEFADDYKARRISRRTLLKRALLVTGSIPMTASALVALGCGDDDSEPAATAPASTGATTVTATTATSTVVAPPPTAATTTGVTVQPTDPAIRVEDVSFTNGSVQVKAYLARPAAAGSYPAVLVIHENRGLNEHTKDIARRYSKEGFVGLAIDLVSRDGGSKADLDANTGFLGRANRGELASDLQAGLDFLKGRQYVKAGALGVTGFCLGGTYAWEIAITSADVRAAAPYYGTVSDGVERVKGTKAAVLAIYGGDDARVTAQAPQVEEQLKALGRSYQVQIYQGANHAFFNDSGARYHAASAQAAWSETVAWFRQHLA